MHQGTRFPVEEHAPRASGDPSGARCPTCLEAIPVGADPCPECGEPLESSAIHSGRGRASAISAGRDSASAGPSIPDDPPGAS